MEEQCSHVYWMPDDDYSNDVVRKTWFITVAVVEDAAAAVSVYIQMY